MIKLISVLLFLLFLTSNPFLVFADSNSFVSIVNPIRGSDFWELKNQTIGEAVLGEMTILDKYKVPATWLLRFDAFDNQKIIETLKNRSFDQMGLFLEITPTWAKIAGVNYRPSNSWRNAGSVFLSGYELSEREKLIDTAFEKFKTVFGNYPKTVGAWWIDANSLSYMYEKYGIGSSLIAADQYTTDNYQIWGQFWSTPYYPSNSNALHPAQSINNKIPVVMIQWAARDPVNAYGNGVSESTFSVQANDYIDYHDLDTAYFERLVNIYTKQNFNQFGFLVVGLENSYEWAKYKNEYDNQIKTLANKRDNEDLSMVTVSFFANWYKKAYPSISSEHLIVADDPLGSYKKAVWFMNPYYRAGFFINEDGALFRDIRQYIDGEEELCFKKRCDAINSATFATRVLDEVSFGHKWIIDEGKISDFKVSKARDKVVITYKNEADRERRVEFLERDINIDGKISSIDGLILDNTLKRESLRGGQEIQRGFFKWSPINTLFNIFKFLLFLIIGCFIPGYFILYRVLKESSFLKQATISIILGFALVTLLSYLLGVLKLKPFIFMYLFINFLIMVKNYKAIKDSITFKIKKENLSVLGLIFLGIIFQQFPSFKNGLSFPYGIGLWGPNTHDGIWHISLINQLVKSIPPQNPILAGEVLKNYHYFYDLLITVTNYVSGIPVLDLVFRFYPILLSLLLGATSYYLVQTFFRQKTSYQERATFFALFLVYFTGSFGWIVEYIKKGKILGGESAFWANQSISFNLNPPFAISLLFCIAIFLILHNSKFNKITLTVLTILAGSLISFKAYGAILIILAFLIVGLFKKSLPFLIIFCTSSVLAAGLFLSNFSIGKQLIIFSPFWFIHSMIDSPDRVGWTRLSLARIMGLEEKNWFKFITSEVVSFFIFVAGNLGTRVFALLSLVKIKTILKDSYYLYVFIFCLLAFFIPAFFIQAGNPWNTIQFLYYFLYISAVVGGILFAKIITKSKKLFAAVATIVFLIITPVSSWSTARGYLVYQPHGLITNQELEALRFLESTEEGIVLTYPYNPGLKKATAEPWPISFYDSTAYVSALSKKAVFIEDEPQNQILLTDYKKRLIAAKYFFTYPYSKGNKFLNGNNIKYIYLPKIYKLSLDEQKLNLKVIFENQQVIIYQVN